MDDSSAPLNTSARKAKREQMMFAAYYLMSPRSLELLAKAMQVAGVKISFRTLASYSSDFHWQERCKELDAQFKTEREKRILDSVVQMNSRQIKIGQAMQSIGVSALRFLQGERLSANEIANLVKQGVQIERLAAGVATSRREVLTALQDEVVRELAVVFTRVNALPDPNERTRQFAMAADKVMETFMLQEAHE